MVVYQKISEIVISFVQENYFESKEEMLRALNLLLDERTGLYNFGEIKQNTKNVDLQRELFKINEKTDKQKTKGVYYTPEDVCKYIIWNSMIMYLDENNSRTYKEKDAIEFVLSRSQEEIESVVFNKTFFDPTCGSGEFLIHLFRIKMFILSEIRPNYVDADVYQIAKTIFGNDILKDSTDISKIRLFFEVCGRITNKKYYSLIANTLNSQFMNSDFVLKSSEIKNKFDVIIGNPPYVEYGKFESRSELENKFGNIYADVIKNSIDALKRTGVLGFIIPLSYISTSRMSSIRNYVIENTNRQFILNFADRPDCLFQGVHQKLNIIVARKGREEHHLFTSNYRHWYKEERSQLLNGCEIKENRHVSDSGVPKIGNQLEENIYRKVKTITDENVFNKQVKKGNTIYLNMRACFWIKAFSFNPGSKEYKDYCFDSKIIGFINCILNSSLFWLYWTLTSDCWHITTKELKGFYVPKITKVLQNRFSELAVKLEEKLEKTKRFIGTKQVEYEYKHKECKDLIDEIDTLLAGVYGLSNEELEYVKNYALKYRTGGSTGNDQND